MYSSSNHPRCKWVCSSSKQIWRNVALHHLLISGSEWVPSQSNSSPSINILWSKKLCEKDVMNCPLSIILLSPVKKSSRLNQEINMHQSSSVSKPKQLKMKRDYGILSRSDGLKLKHLNDGFVDINWWTGVVWITYGLLWCFYQLFGLSFWRHPFTAEHPLVSKWWNAESPNLMKKQTHLCLGWPEGAYTFSANFLFWLNCSCNWNVSS